MLPQEPRLRVAAGVPKAPEQGEECTTDITPRGMHRVQLPAPAETHLELELGLVLRRLDEHVNHRSFLRLLAQATRVCRIEFDSLCSLQKWGRSLTSSFIRGSLRSNRTGTSECLWWRIKGAGQ